MLRTPECIELSNPGGFRVDVKAAISRIGQYHYNRNIREQLAHPCGRAWAGDGLTRKTNDHETVQPARDRTPLAKGVGRCRPVQGDRGSLEVEEVRARDVPVPLGRHPHGTRAQLHHRRRRRALLQDARLRRAASHGLGRVRPAGRERGHQVQQPSGQMDLRQHRHAEGQLQAHGLLVRLGPHRGGVRPRVLPLGPVDLPAVLEARFGRAPQQPGELVPELRDGARERAGHRGRVLALPRRGGEARPHAVVLQDHRLRPGAAGRPRPAGRLARARQADAGELDRPLRRRRNRLRAVRARRRGSCRADGRRRDHRVHHASRHLVRLLVLPAGARVQGSYGAGGGH